MKQRFGFVSNSSSCSFFCKLSLKSIEAWDWDDPKDHDMYECNKCGSSFLITEVRKHKIEMHPNQAGYIEEDECPVCQGRLRIVVLKDGQELERGLC
jgi:hypothetical protein